MYEDAVYRKRRRQQRRHDDVNIYDVIGLYTEQLNDGVTRWYRLRGTVRTDAEIGRNYTMLCITAIQKQCSCTT